MIADSEYKVDELVLSPLAGVVAGVIAATVMLGVVIALQPLSDLNAEHLLISIGQLFGQYPTESGGREFTYGMLLHLTIGGLCGGLYALSQQRIPLKGYMVVGFFYGLVIWIVGGLILGAFSAVIREAFRGVVWLIACLVFGLCMGAAAIWLDKRNSTKSRIVAKD